MTELPDRALPERDWVRSTLCQAADCVEVSVGGSEVAVRSSKEWDGAFLRFDRLAWREFLAGVNNGEFDRPPNQPPLPPTGRLTATDQI